MIKWTIDFPHTATGQTDDDLVRIHIDRLFEPDTWGVELSYFEGGLYVAKPGYIKKLKSREDAKKWVEEAFS